MDVNNGLVTVTAPLPAALRVVKRTWTLQETAFPGLARPAVLVKVRERTIHWLSMGCGGHVPPLLGAPLSVPGVVAASRRNAINSLLRDAATTA